VPGTRPKSGSLTPTLNISCPRAVFASHAAPPNLSNYLWSDDGVVLIDWENSGYNNPAIEPADMAEHASTRALSEDFWTELADVTELTHADRARVVQGRRLMACFWARTH
jgi:thiamine kinase-like enzyme